MNSAPSAISAVRFPPAWLHARHGNLPGAFGARCAAWQRVAGQNSQAPVFHERGCRATIYAMDLYIIRHAQSTNNALPAEVELQERVCDPLLTELGYRQAEHLAEHLATGRDGWSEAASADPEAGGSPSAAAYGITRLVCSPMRRTLLTAQPASRTLGLQPEIWLDIHEHGGIYLDHGEPAGKVGYPGITRPEVHAQFPGYRAAGDADRSGLVARWLRGMGGLPAPGWGCRPQAAGNEHRRCVYRNGHARRLCQRAHHGAGGHAA